MVNSTSMLLTAGVMGYRAIYSLSIILMLALVVLYTLVFGREKTGARGIAEQRMEQ